MFHRISRTKASFAAVVLIGSLVAMASLSRAEPAPPLSEQEAHDIAMEAYIYSYPLLMMDATRRQATNVAADKTVARGPANAFTHVRAYPTAEFRDVVRPNFDTLYSLAWLDLTKEPLVVSVPNTDGRYYLLPMLDMWSDVFAVPGKRTSGTKAATYTLVPPGWSGTLPPLTERIDAPTPYVWIIGRTQTNGPKDYDAVHKVQDGFTITPLSRFGINAARPAEVEIDPAVDMKTPPLDQVNKMPAADYFRHAAQLMAINPPHPTDWSTVARMKRIGLEAGKPFDVEKLPQAIRAAVDRGAADGLKSMYAKIPTLARTANGWQMNTDTMGVYGNYYLKRAIIALVGLGANQPDDAVYPLLLSDADGKPLTGEGKYVLHFSKEELPPAEAFWSLTMYDDTGFQVANPINRFAIGDRDPLKFNPDGSLDIYIQHDSPGADKEPNWLPSPASGTLGATMRLYAPAPQVLDGRWNPPPVKKVS